MNARAGSIANRGSGDRARVLVPKLGLCASGLGAASLRAGPALAQSKPDFAHSAKGIVEALDLQTAFPNPAVAAGADSWSLNTDVAHVLLWIAVAVGAVVIALYLRDILPGGGLARRKAWGAAEADPLQTASGAQAQAQLDAD